MESDSDKLLSKQLEAMSLCLDAPQWTKLSMKAQCAIKPKSGKHKSQTGGTFS